MPSCGVCLSVCVCVCSYYVSTCVWHVFLINWWWWWWWWWWCVCVTFVSCVKMNRDIFNFFSPSGSHTILVFPYPTGWWYSDGNTPLTGASNAGGVGKKTWFWTNIWLRCIQLYSVVNRTSREVWKTIPRRTAASVEHSPRRPSSAVRTRRRRSVCDGLDVIRRRRREVTPPPGHNNLVFCCRRTS